jgi:cbb3-type cytochrome oxidase subunit 1/cytochrome c2
VTAGIEVSERDGEAVGPQPPPVPASGLVRYHLGIAAGFLLLAGAFAALAAWQLAAPDVFGDLAAASYGRMFPMAINALLLGWLTIGFLGAVYYVLPRASGVRLVGEGMAAVSLFLLTFGIGLGIGAVYLGASEGTPYLELPLWADVFVIVGLFLAAVVATRTVAQRKDRLGPPQWYLTAATWWLALIYLAGNLPGIPGFSGAIQGSFYRAGVTGLWFAAAGVGVAYYLIPKLAGTDPVKPSALSALGFWSLAFVWAGTGARDVIYGPGADWYETLGIALSIALLVPVVVIFADLAIAMRGRWGAVEDRITLRFVVAGAWLFAVIPLANLLVALRTSSAVVQFTEWVPAFDYLAYYGAFSLWLFAFAYYALGAGRGPSRPGAALWHFRYTVIGLGIALVAMWAAGLLGGFTWVAGVNSGLYENFGSGWFNTTTELELYYGVRAVGILVYALAQLLFVVGVFGALREGNPAAVEVTTPALDLQFEGSAPVVSWTRLTWGAFLLFFGAALFAWFLPSLEGANGEGTILADEIRVYPDGSPQAAGRQVYLEAGCQYCHTQEVRAIVTDVGLGPVSVVGDYVHEDPILLGTERVGPDLMHAASRENTGDPEWLRAHLRNPQAERPWSNMPSYSFLSDRDFDDLIDYLLTLK